MRVIVAAAGTAGHINPGLAIANKIKEEEPDSEIIFIGTKRGLENDLVPRAGYELKTIEAYGLSKKISIENFKKMYATLMATGKARKIIKEFKPDIIVGAGGYICGPVVWAANKEKIPVVLHESNAFPGKAVKMLAPKVNTVLISFEEARSRIPKARNIVCTGTPVKISKKEYTVDEKNKILNSLKIKEDLPIVLIFGGSQGAQKINEAVIGILENQMNKDYQIIWATGPKQLEIIKKELSDKKIDIENVKKAIATTTTSIAAIIHIKIIFNTLLFINNFLSIFLKIYVCIFLLYIFISYIVKIKKINFNNLNKKYMIIFSAVLPFI